MLLHQRNEVRRRIASQRRLGEMRIGGKKIVGLAVDIREIAATAAGDEDLFPEPVGMLQNRDAASALARLDGAHQASRAAAENQRVE